MTPRRFHLTSADDTSALAARIGSRLIPGDCLLLQGDIGAGKTHFARALIRSRLTYDEDVPSPTFTLVQTYDAGGTEIWHSDLYRLSAPEEIDELGLSEAFDTAICLIEWPDRLGDLIPARSVMLVFSRSGDADDARDVTLQIAGRDGGTLMHRLGDV